MIRHTRTFGAIGAALLSAIAAAGCTNYIEASNPTSQILGVMVQDVNDNEVASPGYCSTSLQTCTADADCTGFCSTATLETCSVDGDCNGTTSPLGFCSSTTTWGCDADTSCPGFCSTTSTTGCFVDEGCPPGETCNFGFGACSTSGDDCILDGDCPTGETCVGYVAQQTCDTATGQTCVIAPAQTCTYNSDPFVWPFPPRTGPMFAEGYVGGAVMIV